MLHPFRNSAPPHSERARRAEHNGLEMAYPRDAHRVTLSRVTSIQQREQPHAFDGIEAHPVRSEAVVPRLDGYIDLRGTGRHCELRGRTALTGFGKHRVFVLAAYGHHSALCCTMQVLSFC
jgi:hypothetical protein